MKNVKNLCLAGLVCGSWALSAQGSSLTIDCHPAGKVMDQEKHVAFSYEKPDSEKGICRLGRANGKKGFRWSRIPCSVQKNETEYRFALKDKKSEGDISVVINHEHSDGEFFEGHIAGQLGQATLDQELRCEIQDI